MDKLRDGVGMLFPKNLSHFLLKDNLIGDISFIAIKDENPVAYMAMDFLNKDLKVISASYAAVASNYRKTPAFCLVLFETISKIFENKSAAKVFSCVESNNKPMIGAYEGVMAPLVSSKKNNLVYRKNI